MGTRTRHRRHARAFLVAAAVLTVGLTGPAAQAAPVPPPQPPPAQRLPEGPWPPSEVLAADPATVTPPDTFATAAANCPPAPFGVQNSAPGAGKTVALTFDDGPGTSTDAILRVLRQNGVAATFFNIGINENARPATVRAIADQGLLLANHSWSHPDMSRLTAAQQAAEMDNASAQQASIVGRSPCFFRPPYGAYNNTTLTLAQQRGMAVFNWSVDTLDWEARGSADQVWVNRIISLAQGGADQTHPVILFHNSPAGNPATVAALPAIISFYKARGYTFVDLAGRVAVPDRHVTGDWDGNGTVTPGLVRGNVWYLRNSNTVGPPDIVFGYGLATDRVVTGDWDGNGTTTPGIVRGATWYLRNSNSGGAGQIGFTYGSATDRVVTGDWDGNGTTTPGVVRGTAWYLRNSLSGGTAEIALSYGRTTDKLVTGDWDGNGTTTPGVVRGNVWYLRNTNTADPSAVTVGYGASTDVPVTGDWDANNSTTVGVVRGTAWHLRNSNTAGPGELSFTFAP